MKKLAIIMTALFSIALCRAEDAVADGNTNLWFLMINRFTLSDKFTITNEFHERTGNLFSEQGQLLLRPSIDYHIDKDAELSVGYSFIRVWPYAPYTAQLIKNEHNIWEQALLKFSIGDVHFQNRFRQENRWAEQVATTDGVQTISGTEYFNRFRYRLTMSFDLWKSQASENAIFFNAFDELWFAQEKNLLPRDFARNWLYLGLGYRLDKNTNFQLGYLHQYDKTGPAQFISTPVIQGTIFKNIDFR